MHAEPEFAREALRSGARAYVLKEAADSELVGAALSGQRLPKPAPRRADRRSARGSRAGS